MTYSESAQGVMISKARAYNLVTVEHQIDKGEWIDCCDYLVGLPDTKIDDEGYIVSVNAGDVLAWLGY